MDKFITRSSSTGSLSNKRPLDENADWTLPKRPAWRIIAPTGSSGVSTGNRFRNLSADVDPDIDHPPVAAAGRYPKPRRVPPIVIDIDKTWTHQSIVNLVSNFTKSYHLKYMSNNKVGVFCYSNDCHQKVKDGLKEKEVPFHTFTRVDEKMAKVVVRGIPTTVADGIMPELESHGFPGAKITPLMSSKKEVTCPPILIQLPSGSDIAKFKKIKYLCNCVISIQRYRPTKTAGTQCFRCQRFGHASRNCNLPVRCVKCTEMHSTKDCPKKDRTNPAKCCNCEEEHPANYHKCKERLKYVQLLQKQKAKPMTTPAPHVVNLVRNEGRSSAPAAPPKPPSAKPVFSQTKPLPEESPPNTSNCDTDTLEMLSILKTIQAIKNKFITCETMLDKVVLVLSYLGNYV